MKRVLALWAALLMLAGMGAFAEDEERYIQYVAEISDIVLADSGGAYRLTPSLALTLGIGQDWQEGYLTAEVRKDGECLAGFWAEEIESEDIARFGFSEGKTYGLCNPGSLFRARIMMVCGMEVEDEEDVRLSRTLKALDSFLSAPDRVEYGLERAGIAMGKFLDGCLNLPGIFSSMWTQPNTVTELEDGGFHVSFPLDAGTLEMDVHVTREEVASKPFDYSGREAATYRLLYGVEGVEGFPEAAEQMLENLLSDESLAALLNPLIAALNEG